MRCTWGNFDFPQARLIAGSILASCRYFIFLIAGMAAQLLSNMFAGMQIGI